MCSPSSWRRSAAALLKPLSVEQRSRLEEATARYEKNVDLASDWLLARGIDRACAEKFRLGVVADPLSGDEQYAGMLAIPNVCASDRVVQVRFRRLTQGEGPKYLTRAGDPARLFNLRAVIEATDLLVLTEGELDAISLHRIGVPAVAAPGAHTFVKRGSAFARMVQGIPRVVVVGDNDDAGKEFVERVIAAVPSAEPLTIGGAPKRDVNDVLVEEGERGLRALLDVEEPIPF